MSAYKHKLSKDKFSFFASVFGETFSGGVGVFLFLLNWFTEWLFSSGKLSSSVFKKILSVLSYTKQETSS